MIKSALPKIKTSEEWHLRAYGLPEKCYEHTFRDGRTPPEQAVEMITRNFSKIPVKLRDFWETKWDLMVKRFPFYKSKRILDVGSPGHGDELLLRRQPNIEEIICVDGDKEAIECFRPFLNSKIMPIYCNFYEENFPQLNGSFDTIMQIDLPEHLPDRLYEEVTKWAVEFLTPDGVLFIKTPCYPSCIDQRGHVSVKSLAYYFDFFDRINMKVRSLSADAKIRLVVSKGDKL